jgi:hypothetical protein
MNRLLLAVVPTIAVFLAASTGCAGERGAPSVASRIDVAETDWPWWRGPHQDGVASANQSPPLQWSDSQNVLWKSPIPGRGHSSPIVVGHQVLLTTADEEREIQSVLCFDRDSGTLSWQSDVHTGGLSNEGNAKTSQASSSVACDGERFFVNFLNRGAVFTTALSRAGKQLWQTRVSDFVVHQGFGSSPAVYGPLVLVATDHKGGGVIAALDRATGQQVWMAQRPKTANYASPIIVQASGREQLVLTGCDLVASFDPLTGKKMWEIAGSTTECVTSVVTDGQLIFTSGGYPKNHVSAVRADGSGTIAWENQVRVYVPSMLVRDGHLYAVTDAGVAMCWKCNSGEEVWKGRLGGTFSASPVLVGDRIFATNEAGSTFAFAASSAGFQQLAENRLGSEVFATPTFCGSRIFMRVADRSNDRRDESLYCIGQPPRNVTSP